ncbi:MAG TPA: PA14 domain-containing protein [Anaerolineae bacterium]|nr:PA14 domain-containing protein [Anaerolineae bacterium]
MRKVMASGILLIWVWLGLSTPSKMAGNDWYAEYYANSSLAGAPALTRFEPALRFEWGGGSPDATIPVDNFSARFSHAEWFNAGTYRFSYRSDDGIRLWVGDTLVIDDWRDHGAAWNFVEHYIASGTHQVRVEYYERGGSATLEAAWEKVTTGAAWRADYFGNEALAGAPVLTRYDTAVDFDWGSGSPHPNAPVDGFSARWTRTLGFEAGTYRFYGSCDDGVRIFVDGNKIVDAWQKQSLPNTHSGDITLSAGQHTVVVEYFEEGGQASAHVWWDRLETFNRWEGRYYDNRELRGGPALIRNETEINFDWGEGAPATWMPSDNFSAVWTRSLDFKPGLYRFNVRADDGFRLWIDETDLRMNFWEPQDFVWRYQDWHYLSGVHTLKLEYFEAAGNARVQLWWDYAATIEAAQSSAPSPTYGFAAAAAPAAARPPATTGASGATPRTPVPSAPLPGPWQGEYFDGRDLSGTPLVTRSDTAIDFDWGRNAPATEVPADQFSVRWTGTFTFESGRYRFTTTTDDGVRLYVDDQLVINSWRPMRGTRYATVSLAAGQHTVRVEYFDATQAAKARVLWTRIGEAIPTTTPKP